MPDFEEELAKLPTRRKSNSRYYRDSIPPKGQVVVPAKVGGGGKMLRPVVEVAKTKKASKGAGGSSSSRKGKKSSSRKGKTAAKSNLSSSLSSPKKRKAVNKSKAIEPPSKKSKSPVGKGGKKSKAIEPPSKKTKSPVGKGGKSTPNLFDFDNLPKIPHGFDDPEKQSILGDIKDPAEKGQLKKTGLINGSKLVNHPFASRTLVIGEGEWRQQWQHCLLLIFISWFSHTFG